MGEVRVKNLRKEYNNYNFDNNFYNDNDPNSNYFRKEINLEKLKQKKIEKMREEKIKNQIGIKLKLNENSKKIIEKKFKKEKPLPERAKDYLEIKKQYIEINSRINKIK